MSGNGATISTRSTIIRTRPARIPEGPTKVRTKCSAVAHGNSAPKTAAPGIGTTKTQAPPMSVSATTSMDFAGSGNQRGAAHSNGHRGATPADSCRISRLDRFFQVNYEQAYSTHYRHL